ncbi:MAG: hypothetical protein ACLT07_04395 [Clostridia bacterium]
MDRETFELVQELRKHRRRPNRTAGASLFLLLSLPKKF